MVIIIDEGNEWEIDNYTNFHDLTSNNLRIVFIRSLILFSVKVKTYINVVFILVPAN